MQIINKIGQYRQREFFKRDVAGITQIVVHHSAYRQDDQTDDARMRAMQGWHQNKDWGQNEFGAGLMYHFFVSKTGIVYQVNDLDDLTWTDFDNYSSLSVILDGSFEREKPTVEQLQSLEWLLNELSFNRPQFPAGQADVKAHREVQATINRGGTECCGRNLLPYVIEYRNTGKITIPVVSQPQQQPSQPKPETTLVTNKYYQGLLNDGNVALAVSDLIHRDVEIANLKAKVAKQDDDLSTLHLQAMNLGNPKSTQNTNQKPAPIFEPQHAQTNTANNFIQPTDKAPLIESWRAKITSGHIMEVLQSFFWGFFGYLVLIKFDLQSYSDPIGIIGGLITALQQYTAIRQRPAQLPNQN